MKKKRIWQKVFLLLIMLTSLFPLFVMLFGSFKNNTSLLSIPPDFSLKNVNFDNYIYVFKKGILSSILNSLVISITTTLIVVFIDSLAGYVFARKKFTGKKIFFVLLLGTMMIPKQILMVPSFILLVKMGLYDNIFGTILSSSAIPFGVFLLKQRMEELPDEIFDAAELDGCNEWYKFSRIAIPLSINSILSLALFIFVQTWNDFMWQLVTLSSKNNLTLPLFISNLLSEKSIMISYQFASSVIATLPIVYIFIKTNKHFINDSINGSIKG